MVSDCHQILALSHHVRARPLRLRRGRKRYGDRDRLRRPASFIVVANLAAYLVALTKPKIFRSHGRRWHFWIRIGPPLFSPDHDRRPLLEAAAPSGVALSPAAILVAAGL